MSYHSQYVSQIADATNRWSKNFPPLPARPSLTLPPSNKNEKVFTWEYLSEVFEAFSQRERAMEMRIEALCFNAEQSLQALSDDENIQSHETENANPVLGVRLLQRVDLLQKENDDLAERVKDLMQLSSSEQQIQDLKREVEGSSFRRSLTTDSHKLISALDSALSNMEAAK